MHADGWMQPQGRRPRFVAYASDIFATRAGGRHRQGASVAGNNVTIAVHLRGTHLHALDGRVDIARHASGGCLLAENVPGFQRLSQFELHAVTLDRSIAWEPEFKERRKPIHRESVAGIAEIAHDIAHVLRDEVRKHEAIMQA